MLWVRIHRLTLYGYHGVFKEESVLGGKYEVDVEIEYDSQSIEHIAEYDDLHHAIDYARVIDCVKRVFAVRHNLIETLALQIAHAILDEFHTARVAHIRVRKFAVPISECIAYTEAEAELKRTSASL